MRFLVCVSGMPRSGKNTLAGQLRDAYGFGEVAIAAPLYEEVARAFGVKVSELQSNEWKTTPQNLLASWCADEPDYRKMLKGMGVDLFTPQTSRFHLRHWGTEYRRSRDPMYWANAMLPSLDGIPGSIVINDMRRMDANFTEYHFLREYAAKHHMQFALVTVSRDGQEAWGHSSDDPFPDHMVDLAVTNVEGDPTAMLGTVTHYINALHGVEQE